jgi:hypothetical protein
MECAAAPFDKSGRLCLPAAMQTMRIWGTLDPFVEGGEVMGRKVANAGFLDALLAADPFDAYHFFQASPGERDRNGKRSTAVIRPWPNRENSNS